MNWYAVEGKGSITGKRLSKPKRLALCRTASVFMQRSMVMVCVCSSCSPQSSREQRPSCCVCLCLELYTVSSAVESQPCMSKFVPEAGSVAHPASLLEAVYTEMQGRCVKRSRYSQPVASHSLRSAIQRPAYQPRQLSDLVQGQHGQGDISAQLCWVQKGFL